VNWGAAAAAAWRVIEYCSSNTMYFLFDFVASSDDRNSAIVIHEPNLDFRPRNNYYDIIIVAVIQMLHSTGNFSLMRCIFRTSYEHNRKHKYKNDIRTFTLYHH